MLLLDTVETHISILQTQELKSYGNSIPKLKGLIFQPQSVWWPVFLIETFPTLSLMVCCRQCQPQKYFLSISFFCKLFSKYEGNCLSLQKILCWTLSLQNLTWNCILCFYTTECDLNQV